MAMDKDRKREIVSEYKQRKTTGGVYKVTNTANGRYMLKAEVDLQSFRNRFNFSMRMKSCLHPKMQKDFSQYGAEVFTLEFLEETEKKEEESAMGFKDRLKRLEEAWAEKFDPEKAY
ncbi:MAG: GIY-YIG nuclease family protein [Eubacteriales bacterium]|nr:GIY-YIG nuclease family protein [Eubacteriales bacterium]